MKTILVTGGCGFIGSNFIRYMLQKYPEYFIVNLDALTYCGNSENLSDVAADPVLSKRYIFIHGDICDREIVRKVLAGVSMVVHFAAESHVDNSIKDPFVFTRTNVLGTHILLEEAKLQGKIERFVHISTDEVYGSIAEGAFKETDMLTPSSPYSSTKAAAELLARSFFITFGFPVLVTRCSNNFGPYQYPEKVIPLFITNLLEGKKVPLYGDGLNVRDWIYVLDHCSAVDFVLHHGVVGEIYNIAGTAELPNVVLTKKILALLGKGEEMIQSVIDRLGHDRRYAIDATKLTLLGWKPSHSFDTALAATVVWYKNNVLWWKKLKK